MSKDILKPIHVFRRRMLKLGIEIEYVGTVPWIYIDRINGKKIKKEDFFGGNHGFTIGFLPIKSEGKFDFLDIGATFDLIRKYK